MGRIHMALRSYSVSDILLPPIIIIIQETQTQTQTKFIQQKYIQVPYQVYMSFLEIQITL